MKGFKTIAKLKKQEPHDLFQPVIRVTDLRYKSILHDIQGTWEGGKLIGLVGPNGAGKSTLIRNLAGILSPTQGEVYVNHQHLHKKPSEWRAKLIAYLPQHMSDQIPYTVFDFIAMGRYIYRTPSGALTKSCVRKIDEELQRLNLSPFRNTPMHELSGGERQRAAIARCIVQESPILLLDEPIAGLDLYYQMDILQQLKNLTLQGYLIIVVLHNIELAARFCSHMVMLKKGRILHQGSTKNVFNQQTVQNLFGLPIQIFNDPYNEHLRMSILSSGINGE